MKFSALAGLRARLVALVLVALAPLVGLIAWDSAQEREQLIASAKNDLSHVARLLAADLASDLNTTAQLLHALGRHPDVRAGREPACGEILRAQKALAEHITDFIVFDRGGWLLCYSGPPRPATRSAADREYFRQAIATRKLAVGRPILSRLDGKAALPLALPLIDAAGEVERVFATGLDLARMGERRSAGRAIAWTAFTVWAPDGTVLYRHPENEKWAGKRHPRFEAWRATLGAGGASTFVSDGLDGIERVYALDTLEEFRDAGILMSVGARSSALTAAADRAFVQNLIAVALLAAAVFAAAWLLAERTVRRPVAALADASRRLAAGDLGARVGIGEVRGELGELIATFNSTAASLQRATRALRVLSEGNRAMLRAGSEQELLDAACRIAVEAGGYRMAWVGFAEHDAIKSVRVAAAHGADREFFDALKVTWADEARGRGPTGTAIRTGGARVMRDVMRDPEGAPWRELARRRGFSSILSIPLRVNGGIAGALAIYAAEVDAFDEREVGLLGEFAADLGFGLQTLRLRQTEDLYEHAPCGYHSVDEAGTIVRINATELAWLGYAREEIVGRKKIPDLLTPQSLETFRSSFPEFKRSGRLSDVEFELVRKDGSILPVSLSATAVYDAEGRYVMSRSTLYDISERRRAREEIARKNDELERANAELAHASDMKSRFLANMSHELRTPLNAIIGFSEVLKDGLMGELNDTQRQSAEDICNAGRHLLELINDILDLSKVESGMMALEPEPVEIGKVFANGLAMVKEKAMKHRVRLDTAVEPGLPAFSADPRKLKQIVFNLVSNAVKFTPGGGRVTLGARRVSRAGVALPEGVPARLLPLPGGEAQEFVEISVADTGIGIAQADLDKLFQPFVQVDSTLSRKVEGTGLGLAMVLNLALLHGGTAGVASEPGRGSTFHVWLPLAQPGAARLPEAAPEETAGTVPARAGAAGPPPALVIEDDDGAAQLIERQLRAEGFRTIRAATGEEGLVRAAKERPCLITLDIFLPSMDGWDVIRRLKADPALASVPVVIISVSRELHHGIALGATRVLQKPFSRAELVASLAGLELPAGCGRPVTVLVVDDNPQAVELLATYLADGGYNVLRAYGGREAIEAARRARPDLILLDLMMPEVSGFDVLEALKGQPDTATIPILVVTAKDLTPEDRAALNGHVLRVMQKASFDRAAFSAEVRRALGKTQGLGS